MLARSSSKRFNPWIYWAAIVASTTVGTALADLVDRSLGIGYPGGVAILVSCLALSLAIWRFAEGTIDVQTVSTPRVEIFYWVTITFSQTLGTALGDWTAELGRPWLCGGALIFAVGLAVLAAAYYWTNLSRVFLFWAAFILTRPLGATVGDFLDKPFSHGGLDLSRPLASAVIAVFIVGCIVASAAATRQASGRAIGIGGHGRARASGAIAQRPVVPNGPPEDVWNESALPGTRRRHYKSVRLRQGGRQLSFLAAGAGWRAGLSTKPA